MKISLLLILASGHTDIDPYLPLYFLPWQTLSDGSVVKINRTVIANTDEKGNAFFFHSTAFNNGKEYDDEEEEKLEHELTEKTEAKKEEFPAIESAEKDAEVVTSTTEKAGIVPSIDEEEEEFNDVLADVYKTKNQQNNKGVDDGLVTIEAVQ